jgi:hypothetical protein
MKTLILVIVLIFSANSYMLAEEKADWTVGLTAKQIMEKQKQIDAENKIKAANKSKEDEKVQKEFEERNKKYEPLRKAAETYGIKFPRLEDIGTESKETYEGKRKQALKLDIPIPAYDDVAITKAATAKSTGSTSATTSISASTEKTAPKPAAIVTPEKTVTTGVSVTTIPSAPLIPFAGRKFFLPKKCDFLTLGGRARSFNSLFASVPPTGFATTSSDSTRVDIELSIEVKYSRFALEYIPLNNTRLLDTKFFGSSLGGINVTTSNVLIAKFFAIDTYEWSGTLGFGAENNKLDGVGPSMGGYTFPTSIQEWTPVFQVGLRYHLTDRISIGVDYERSNVRIATTIPGCPDLVSTFTDRMSVRLMCGIF